MKLLKLKKRGKYRFKIVFELFEKTEKFIFFRDPINFTKNV